MSGRSSACLPLSVCLSVCLSVRIEKLGYSWTDFHEIRYEINFRKSVE